VACWNTKAAMSLKNVKIDEKLLWRAYRNSPTLFRTVPSTTPYGWPLPQDWGSQPKPQTAIAIISEKVLQIWPIDSQVPSEQKSIKIGRQRSVGVSRDCPNFLSTPIVSGMGKLRTSNFVHTFLVSMGTKAH